MEFVLRAHANLTANNCHHCPNPAEFEVVSGGDSVRSCVTHLSVSVIHMPHWHERGYKINPIKKVKGQ